MGLSIELWALVFLLPLIATIGVIGNVIMIIVFIKFKKLRSPCHYLITMCCLADCLHNTSQFIFTAHMIWDLHSSQHLCYLMNLPALIGVVNGSVWMFSLGIDRFIAFKWPIMYRSLHSFAYLPSYFVFPTIFTFLFLFTSHLETSASQKSVTCAIPLAMGDRTFSMFSTFNLVWIFLIVLLYSIVNIMITRKENAFGKRIKAVFKPIFMTVMLVNIGWLITSGANIFAALFVDNAYLAMLINFYAGIPVNMACASNVFVFYSINSDYRESIRNLFGRKPTNVAIIRPLDKISTVTVPPPAV